MVSDHISDQQAVVAFELAGRPFTALNGGPHFTFNEAFSFQVGCDDHEQIDHFCDGLSDGRGAGPCGWLEGRFGVSWRHPSQVDRADDRRRPRDGAAATACMLGMHKLIIAALEEAAAAPV